MKTSNTEILVKRIFGNKVPETIYSAMKDLDKADNALMKAIEQHCVQPYHYTKLDSEKSHMFDLLTDDGIIVIGYLTNRYKEV